MARAPVIDHVEQLSVPALVGQLVDDVKDVARAEVSLYKARAGERLNAYKGAVVFFGIAAVLVLEAVGALLVGLILTLATLIGPGGATAIVVGTVLLIAVALAIVGRSMLAKPPGDSE